jgi:hypothetical protein
VERKGRARETIQGMGVGALIRIGKRVNMIKIRCTEGIYGTRRDGQRSRRSIGHRDGKGGELIRGGWQAGVGE